MMGWVGKEGTKSSPLFVEKVKLADQAANCDPGHIKILETSL